MEILNLKVIKQFVEEHADSEAPLADWVTKTKYADWKTGADVVSTFNKASYIGDNKWIFNIGGNRFRMAAMVWVQNERVYVLKLMTHAEYDKEKF